MITQDQLLRIMPRLARGKAEQFLPHLNEALKESSVDAALRTAAFIAQIAHESGELSNMQEIWGPTDAQRRYEAVSTLATRLGNSEPGDGARFKGRGPIQITGRSNYERYGKLLKVDLLLEPELAATSEVAFRVAGLFWSSNGLNEKADAEDFVTITKRINGGVNGLAERQLYYEKAKIAFATGFIPNGSNRDGLPFEPLKSEPLERGFEAIQEDIP